MTIEHILRRRPIEFTEQEAIDILVSATGLPCADTYADGIGFEDPGDAATEAGVVFAQQFAGRRFSSLTDALLSVIDIQSEMLQAAGSRDSRGGVLQSIADQLGLGAPPAHYDRKRIAWELERTAMGDGYYGNALYAAKEFPEATPSVRSLLDRWATGKEIGLSDRTDLCAFALQVYTADGKSPCAPVDVLVEALEYLMERYPASRHLQDTCSAALAAYHKGSES